LYNEQIKQMMGAAVPMNGHLGIEVVELAPGRGVARLPDRPEIRNHVGSQHAAGLFAVAEAASGCAVIGVFMNKLGEVTPLARSAQISYTKIARGPITATATLDRDATELESAVDAEGKVAFPASVTLTDEQGQTVASVTVEWHVAKRK
jgi:acyl-coenzyme A thioesterase PaaI-like protein